MNELEDILGIKFPSNCEVSSVTNTSKKVKKDSLFFGLFKRLTITFIFIVR